MRIKDSNKLSINFKSIIKMKEDGVFIYPNVGSGNASSIDPNLLLAMNSNGGFGGNGNWMWLIFLWMMWQRNGANGNFADYAAQFGNEGRQYLAEIMNGRFDNLGNLANILNTSVESIKNGIFALQNNISQVAANVGLTAAQTQNAVALGDAALSRQLCECCCNMRYDMAQQTNTMQAQLANHDASVRLQLAQNEAADQLAVCQQTNTLSSQNERNTNSILDAIANQNTMITKEFCDLKERELQNRINAQGDLITQLRGQISNDKQTEAFNAAMRALDDKIDAIAAKQPNTVPVTWPNLVAANATPYIGGFGYGYGMNNGFGGSIIF